METTMKETRSGISPSSVQELIDASISAKHATLGNAQQYQTPIEYARFFNGLLPTLPDNIFDPQCASGNTLKTEMPYWVGKFGFEIDNRFAEACDGVQRIIGNCVSAWEVMDDLFPDLTLECQVANPPFGLIWKLPNGGKSDSTAHTWSKIQQRASERGSGWFISNYKTIERLKIHEDPRVYLYQRFPIGVWKNCEVEIGVVHWDVCPTRPPRQDLVYKTLDFAEHGKEIQQVINFYANHKLDRKVGAADKNELLSAWGEIIKVLEEEKGGTPPFNIYLDGKGYLHSYLSTRFQTKRKLTREEVLKVGSVDGAHPMTLVPERETRKILAELVESGVYTIQPEAKKAIVDALAEVNRLACPIMKTTEFESVAYADDLDTLLCVSEESDGFTKGKRYEISTSSYKFVEDFTRDKPHFDEETGQMTTVKHTCQLSGSDRYVSVIDDAGQKRRFMAKPQHDFDHDEAELWKIFERPVVKTVAESHPELVEANLRIMETCELVAGFKFFPGQKDYLSRVAAKDYGIIAAETGTGKTLFAISLIQMKGPKRALIIAPQGTVRKVESDDGDEDDEDAVEYQASQWISELNRFAPGLPVFQLFSMDDYRRILALNGGHLPAGIFITYFQAMFLNGGRETAPQSWNDEMLEKECRRLTGSNAGSIELDEYDKRKWCKSVGREHGGIRCIMSPSMATQIGHQFDFVALDEAHVACNGDTITSQMLVRLQPRWRFLFTASPIPNVISNLFPLMGWTCVPGWHQGDRLNAAWPYRRHELPRFIETFQSEERDFTQEEINNEKAKKETNYWKKASSKCVKVSPIISSPARLLKILKPSMAYISKRDCNPNYAPPKIVDVRVPFGKEQAKLYCHFLNRGNVPGNHPLVRARRQVAWLRSLCADPAGFNHGGPKVTSNMNPKVICVLELVRDILAEGEQVVIVNSRIGITSTIQQRLSEAGVTISRIDSTIPADQHAFQANWFKSKKSSVMLLGIRCAAAYSFDQCKYEILGSIEYSPGPFNQAIGRIDRVTNKPGKKIYCVLNKNSIEEVQFDTVACKDDASQICLKGMRVPRDYKPVDGSEVLAVAIDRFDITGSKPESECEIEWPKLRARLADAVSMLT